MRYYWLRDKDEQGDFEYYWSKSENNLADYHTKNHTAKHHKEQRSTYVLDMNK